MPRTGPWLTYGQHECLLLVGPCHSRDYVLPAMTYDVCPRCGQPCDLNYRDTWARVVRRKVHDSAWYLPWTWGRFHWEYKELGHLADGVYDYRTAMRNARPDE